MNDMLRFARIRTILDLGLVSVSGGAETRPATWDDIKPDGGPCTPPYPMGTVLEAEVVPASGDDDELRLPRRVICRPDGRWASLPE